MTSRAPRSSSSPSPAPRSSKRAALVVCAALIAAAGCPAEAPVVDTDLLGPLPKGEEQRQALCGRGRADAVTAAFCNDDAPDVSSIADLQRVLGLPLEGDLRAGFSLLAQSSALAGRLVSSINPQSVIVALPADMPDKPGGWHRDDGNIVAMAFARGEPMVEIAVTPPGGELALYLLRYQRPCDDDDGGCDTTDRFSARTESGWTGWSLYDDVDLGNTVLDCLHCHQPNGPGTPRIYRLQELSAPWTHWEATFTLGGRVLLDQTLRAHGVEGTVAGIPGAILTSTDPVTAEDLMRFSLSEQENVFSSHFIEEEVMASNVAQPADNSTPGVSATWELLYDAAVKGDAIPPPYHDVQPTDRAKLDAATQALIDFRSGAASTLPDLSDVFADDALAKMSHRAKPGLSGAECLVHACAQCHNERLDQSLSRAGFDPKKLDTMREDVRVEAIRRLRLTPHDRLKMPPRLFRELSPAEIDAAITALGGDPAEQ